MSYGAEWDRVRAYRRWTPRHLRMQPYNRSRTRMYERIVALNTNGMLTQNRAPVYVQQFGSAYRSDR